MTAANDRADRLLDQLLTGLDRDTLHEGLRRNSASVPEPDPKTDEPEEPSGPIYTYRPPGSR